MSSLNKAIVMGNLGKDPELRHTQNQKAVCNFSIATTEVFKDKKKTEWHRIVVWGKSAENCAKYLKKGSSAMVEGRIQTQSFKGKDGTPQYTTEIIANNVQFLGGKTEDNNSRQGGWE